MEYAKVLKRCCIAFCMNMRRQLAYDAHDLRSLLWAHRVTHMSACVPFANKTLAVGRLRALVATRVYDAEHLFCYQLTFPYKERSLSPVPSSLLLLELEPFTLQARFTVESERLIPSYETWVATDAGVFVQRKTLALPDGSLAPVMDELERLSHVPLPYSR